MPKSDPFVEFVLESLMPLKQLGNDNLRARAMFGGWNLSLGGVTFGLIADGVLYLKVDDTNKPDFVRNGLEAFTYDAKGKTMEMSYRRAPDFLEDWAQLEPWVAGAIRAAREAKRPKRAAKPKK
jgi:DNA transformation protein and related proteins